MKPSGETLRVLLIDDNPDDRDLVVRELRRHLSSVHLRQIVDANDLARALDEAAPDVAVTDYQIRWTDGLTVLRALKARFPDCPVIMFTATGSEDVAVEAMKSGLDDYVTKSPKHLVHLSAAVRSALERTRERQAGKAAESRLRALEKAVECLPLGVTVTDLEGKILYTNPAEAQMHGYTPEELLGKEARGFVPAEFSQQLTPEQIKGLRAWKRERTNVRKDDSSFPAQLISDVVRSEAGEPFALVTTCEDVTERKEAEEKLLRHAFFDGLTGLANRALFMDRLTRAVERARRRPDFRYAVLFLDLDRFKLVNDSLGHVLGDRLLAAVARKLEPCLRPGDTIARFGGDEFAVLAEDIRHETDATRVADRVLRELASPLNLGGHELFTSASIGIALSAAGYSSPEDILRDADTAMYRAKALGKGRYEIFDLDMHARASAAFQLEADLRRALERREFLIHYQPILSLSTGRVIGAEALLRWQHPQRGLLLPEEFINLAEETGLIVPIGEWALRAACAQSRAWRRLGCLAVNLSARQFRQRNLKAIVAAALRDGDDGAVALQLELTESTIMENVDEAVSTLRELKGIGVKVAIDDFGTGYSSLNYLKRFPIDTLKIDRSFVRNITTDRSDAAIAASVITLAHVMDLSVTAEGVETHDQLAHLRARGCDAVQGFLTGPPAPALSLTT